MGKKKYQRWENDKHFFFLSDNEEVESTMSSDDKDTGINEQGRYINTSNKGTDKFKCNMKRY